MMDGVEELKTETEMEMGMEIEGDNSRLPYTSTTRYC